MPIELEWVQNFKQLVSFYILALMLLQGTPRAYFKINSYRSGVIKTPREGESLEKYEVVNRANDSNAIVVYWLVHSPSKLGARVRVQCRFNYQPLIMAKAVHLTSH